jgi:hypothetical protein
MGRCAKAINDSEALAYHFPKTPEELQLAAAGFRSISTNNFITGCVGVMDGLLLRIRVPAASEVGHVTAFFRVIIKPTGLMSKQLVTTSAAS